MKIAQVSPLFESVPPKCYGGTERVVSYLTEALVDLGHEVTLFASGDSVTSARLVPVCARSLRLDSGCLDQVAHHVLMLDRVLSRAHEFDLVHWHVDYLHFPLSRRSSIAHVTTLHGRLDLPDLVPIYDEFSDVPVISISDAQRAPLPQARWVGTVHHGLPSELYRPGKGKDGYFAFLGRISPEKRVDRAIRIATRLGVPLRIAAKVDRADTEYFHSQIEPLLDHPLVEYLGEIGDADKNEFLGRARALLFPIDWPEPFGLVMIEAMACATPVIAYRCGSVPEVMEHGVTGFVVEGDEEAVHAASRAGELDRSRIRQVFEQRYTNRAMATRYLPIYDNILGQRAPRRAAASAVREVAA
jgi:glycosyltransferase involved in cell wall biosynthesis